MPLLPYPTPDHSRVVCAAGLACVGAYRLDADAQHIAFVGEETHAVRMEAGRV